MLFSDGPVTAGEWPCRETGVDSRGIRRQFDTGFEPDGGLDVCELSLKRSIRVSMFTNNHVRDEYPNLKHDISNIAPVEKYGH